MLKNRGTSTPQRIAGTGPKEKIFRATRLKCVPAKEANKEALLTASMR